MSTYLDLQTNIATDLTRSDLTSQIKGAIQDAIHNYESDRFWFNVTRSKTFSTVIGQTAYGSAALAEIPNIIRIDDLFLIDSGRPFALDRYEMDEFEYLQSNSTGNGRPCAFTYADGQILFWPAPVAVYTIRPHMHYRLSTLSADADSNAWCNEAERLIRAHAKLLLYTNLLEDDAGMQRTQLQIPSLKSKLDYETSAHTATGRIRGTDF